jgi:hypothetical protein
MAVVGRIEAAKQADALAGAKAAASSWRTARFHALVLECREPLSLRARGHGACRWQCRSGAKAEFAAVGKLGGGVCRTMALSTSFKNLAVFRHLQ